ncbi:MAG: DegV family protein [Clostridia bacterium]|nr:DegV family protein [Clostridia bacterium]
MERIKFITDSAGDLPKEYVKEKNIDVLPFHVYLKPHEGEVQEYFDGVDITSDEVFSFMEENKGTVSTSQVTAFTIEEYFRELAAKNEYDTYIFTCISSAGSPTYNNVKIALKNLEEDGIKLDVRLVDSKFYTICYYYAMKEGIAAYEKGASADEIVKIISDCCASNNIFMVNGTLEYLKRGGRITGASALLGTILDIKPILTVKDGLVAPHEKVRGIKKAMSRIMELVKDATKEGGYRYMIVYSTKASYYDEFVQMVHDNFPGEEIHIDQVGSTIGVHIGPGLVGLMFQKKM